jgi:hypothetical protein
VTRGWRTLHKEDFHNLCSSLNIIRTVKSRRILCAGHLAGLGEMKNAYRILVGKPEGERPLGRTRYR